MPELIWEGKYDKAGKRPGPPKIALPFQTVETVNESAQERQRSLDFFANDRPSEWRNRLIWGDNKYVLSALREEFAGKVDLIYIDPPFATGQDFSVQASVGDSDFVKEPSAIEQKAYRDTWGRGLDSYFQFMYDRLHILRDLMAPNGAIFVHLDAHMSPHIKVMMDEIFGQENFQNQIAWYYYNKLHGASKRTVPKAFDVILYYVKDREAPYTFHTLTEPREKPVKKLKYKFIDGKITNLKDEFGKTITYESTERQLDNVWRIRCLQPANKTEWVDYPTQKPVDLIERILATASNPGDLVLDCFSGSGTTAVAAERMERRWIAADIGRFAIHTTRKRLLDIPDVQPLIVQNLGKYERQLWQQSEFGASATARTAAYRAFILNLYKATPVSGYSWLHGLRRGRMVHVGTVDAPVTNGDVKQIVAEFRKAVGSGKDAPSQKGVDLLGWDFAFELNEVARQDAERAGIDLRLVRIPREVLDRRAVEQGDIRFAELAALSVGSKQSDRKVTLELEDFVIPLDDVPADVQNAISHWSQWIDYWAVDWDNKDDTFHNEWQAFRTRSSRDLSLVVDHEYEEPGKFTVVVKVIDILGNDTTKVIALEVPCNAS